jgi:hypothetical protein
MFAESEEHFLVAAVRLPKHVLRIIASLFNYQHEDLL